MGMERVRNLPDRGNCRNKEVAERAFLQMGCEDLLTGAWIEETLGCPWGWRRDLRRWVTGLGMLEGSHELGGAAAGWGCLHGREEALGWLDWTCATSGSWWALQNCSHHAAAPAWLVQQHHGVRSASYMAAAVDCLLLVCWGSVTAVAAV